MYWSECRVVLEVIWSPVLGNMEKKNKYDIPF